MSTSFESRQGWALPYWTNASQAATGATTLVASPGAGLRIAVDGLRVTISTDTASRIPCWFFEDTSTIQAFYSNQNLTIGASALNVDLQTPWLLQTNTALGFAIGSMGSTPGVVVDIRYRVVS